MMQAQSKSYTGYTDVTNSDSSAQNDANFLHILSGVIGVSMFVLVMTVISLAYPLPSPDFYAMISLGVIIAYQCADGRVIAAAMDALSTKISKYQTMRRKHHLRTQQDSNSGAEQEEKEKKKRRVYIPPSLKLGLAVSALLSICLALSVPLGAMWCVPEPLVGIFTVMLLVTCSAAFNVLFARIQAAHHKSNCTDYTIGSSIIRKSAGVSRKFKAVVYSVLVIGIIIFIKSWVGLVFLPSYSLWHVFNFMTSDLFHWTNFFYYTGAVLTAFMLFKKDWSKVRIHIDSLLEIYATQFGKTCKRSWTFGKKIVIVPVLGAIASIIFFALSWIPLIVFLPLISTCAYLALLSFTAWYQKMIRILGWMISRWAKKNLNTVKYRGKTAYQYWNHERRVALTAACLIVFCNITPIFIQSLWDPGMANYLQSNEYSNNRLAASSAGLNPLGEATFLFLEKTANKSVVCSENGWQSGIMYDGVSHWTHSFSANGTAYMNIDITGIFGLNISLVYPNFERMNYTTSLGENQFSVYFGEEITEYEIQVADSYKQYISRIVIQPLWIQYWDNDTLEYSSDSNLDNKITGVDTPYHIFEREFFAHGEISIYFYQPSVSYNALYIELDDLYVIQNLHPITDAQGNSEFITSDAAAEFLNKGHALRYDIDLDDMFLHESSFTNYSWNGWHFLKIGICAEYMDNITGIDEKEFEIAILSSADSDFDGDSLTNDEEVNLYNDLMLSPEYSDTWAYWNVKPETNMQSLFKSNWSAAELVINYRDLMDSLLYIDICSNESAYQNFTINGEPVWNGSMLGEDIRFMEDGLWSMMTDTYLEYGYTYTVSFLYDTRTKYPVESLIFSFNGEIIPIITTANTKYLSQSYIDTDADGILDTLDDSPETSLSLQADKIWRLITDVQKESDTEIHFQIKPPSNNLYSLTHNSSGIYYEWNNESIVSITPVLRLYSDVITRETYDTVDYTYNGKELRVAQGSAWSEVQRFSWNEFQQYWDNNNVDDLINQKFFPDTYSESFGALKSSAIHLRFGCIPSSSEVYASYTTTSGSQIVLLQDGTDYTINDTDNDNILDTIFLPSYQTVHLVRVTYEIDDGDYDEYVNSIIINALSDPNSIQSYDTDCFGDNPPRYYDGVPYTSQYDGFTDTSIQNWFRYYVDNIWGDDNDYYSDADTQRYYYQMFVNSLVGDTEGEIIDLTADETTFEGSIFVPANHTSKLNEILDLKMNLLWKMTDLNIFDTVRTDFSDVGRFDGDIHGDSAYRKVSDVYSFNISSQKMTVRTRTYQYDEVQEDYIIDSTTYEDIDFANCSLWIPSYNEIMNGFRGNDYLSYIEWKDFTYDYTGVELDESILDTRYGNYHSMVDITGKVLPPGTKIYNHGVPRLMHYYPWEAEEDVVVQSIKITEHESVDYILGSPENVGEHTILSNLVKNKELWDVNSNILNPTQGGINITDDIYGTKTIKTTTALNLMSEVYNDFSEETAFGMGWGYRDYPFSNLGPYNPWFRVIDNKFIANGSVDYIWRKCYDYTEEVIKFGETSNKYTGSLYSNFNHGLEDKDYVNGSISLNVAGIEGSLSLKLRDKLNRNGLNLGFNLQYSPNWLVYTSSGYENTGIKVLDRFQRIDIVWAGAEQRMIIYIDGQMAKFQTMSYVPILNNVKNISSIVIDMTGFVGYFNDFSIPAWAQSGSQTKVLYQNSVYSTRDLCKTITYNLNYKKYIGNFFEFNDTSFYLRYDPDRFAYDLFYSEEPAQFIDYIDTTIDTTTFDFDQPFLKDRLHPYFTASSPLTHVEQSAYYSALKIYNRTATQFIPFKNGKISGDLYFPHKYFPNGSILNLNYWEVSNDLSFKPASKNITVGSVNGKYGIKVGSGSWIASDVRLWGWEHFELSISNQTGTWMLNFTISNSTTSDSILQSLSVAESEWFASVSFDWIDTLHYYLDNLSISTMTNVYTPFEYPEYNFGSKQSYSTHYLGNISYPYSESIVISESSMVRNFETSIESGKIEFNLGITGSDLDLSISLLENSNTYGMDLNVTDGALSVTMLGVEDTLYDAKVRIENDSMNTLTFIIGETTVIAGHSVSAFTLLWNNIYVGTYEFEDADTYQHVFTGIRIFSEKDCILYLNSMRLTDIPDIACSDSQYSFKFDGYWHNFMPDQFVFNNLSFDYDLYWTGEFMFPNETVFAYINQFTEGVAISNYSVQWRNDTWNNEYLPVAQYWNGTGWTDGDMNLDFLWCDVLGLNSQEYCETIEIGDFGAKIVNVNSANLTINEYTELADYFGDDSDGVNEYSPYNSSLNAVFELSGIIIYRRKTAGSGFDVISEIGPTSYRLNGSLIQGNICTSEYAQLPFGSRLIKPSDGNTIGFAFNSIVELFSAVPASVSFDFRYSHEFSYCYFESQQLSSNSTDIQEFFEFSSKQDSQIMWSKSVMEDYNETTQSSVPIKSLYPVGYPTSISFGNYEVLNASSLSSILVTNISIGSFSVNPLCQNAHIEDNVNALASNPFVNEISASYIYLYLPVSQNLWQYEDAAVSNLQVDNNWKNYAIGNLFFQQGTNDLNDLARKLIELSKRQIDSKILAQQLLTLRTLKRSSNLFLEGMYSKDIAQASIKIEKVLNGIPHHMIRSDIDYFCNLLDDPSPPLISSITVDGQLLGWMPVPIGMRNDFMWRNIQQDLLKIKNGYYDDLFEQWNFLASPRNEVSFKKLKEVPKFGDYFHNHYEGLDFRFHSNVDISENAHISRGTTVAENIYGIFWDQLQHYEGIDSIAERLAYLTNVFLYQCGQLQAMPADVHQGLHLIFGKDYPYRSYSQFIAMESKVDMGGLNPDNDYYTAYSHFKNMLGKMKAPTPTSTASNAFVQAQKTLWYVSDDNLGNPNWRKSSLLLNVGGLAPRQVSMAEIMNAKEGSLIAKQTWGALSDKDLTDAKFKNAVRFASMDDRMAAFLAGETIDANAKFCVWTKTGFQDVSFKKMFILDARGKSYFKISLPNNDLIPLDFVTKVPLVPETINGKLTYRLMKNSDIDMSISKRLNQIKDLLMKMDNYICENFLKPNYLDFDDFEMLKVARRYILEGLFLQSLSAQLDSHQEIISTLKFKDTSMKTMLSDYNQILGRKLDGHGLLLKIHNEKFGPNIPHLASGDVGSAAVSDQSKHLRETTAVETLSDAKGVERSLRSGKSLKDFEMRYYGSQQKAMSQINDAFLELGISPVNTKGKAIETMSLSKKTSFLERSIILQEADQMAGGNLLGKSPKARAKMAAETDNLLKSLKNADFDNLDDAIRYSEIEEVLDSMRGVLETPGVKSALLNLEMGSSSWRSCMGRTFMKEVMKESIIEVFTYVYSMLVINSQLQNGLISQEEAIQQWIMESILTGLDIGMEMLAALRTFHLVSGVFSKIAAVAGIVGLIITAVQIGYMVYLMATLPAIGEISRYSMYSQDRSLQKWGSYHINETIAISERYGNYEFPMVRTDFLRLSARTSLMPKNLTHPERPHYNCSQSLDPYANRSVFILHPEWSFDYIDGEPALEEWYSTRVDTWAWFDWVNDVMLTVPLNNLTRREVLYTHQIYGTVKQTSAQDIQFWDEYDIGAVVEDSLDAFVSNMKVTSNDLSDADGDGIPQVYEIANKTISRKADTDCDRLDDLDELEVYFTDPTEIDTDGDSLSDYAEIMVLGTDPLLPDSDFDGLNDFIEVQFFTNSSAADTDSDGLSDMIEYELGTCGNYSDSDNDGLIDLTEIRLGYDAMDSDSPTLYMAQSAFVTTPIGFHQGTYTFNMLPITSDPWYTHAMAGEAYIAANYGTPEHNFIYLFNGSAVRAVDSGCQMMSQDWRVESFVSVTNQSTFNMEVLIANGYYFGLRYDNATSTFQYGFNGISGAWTSFTSAINYQDIGNWSVWAVDWDYSAKHLNLSVDLNSDQVSDYIMSLNTTNCPLLSSVGGSYMNRILFENAGCGIGAIDSVSIWTQSLEWTTGYEIGDLYNIIEFPDLYTEIDRTSSTITFEWAQIDDMQMGIYYDDESFVDIHSQNIFYEGPFASTATIKLESDGTWYFKPCAIFEGYYFPLGTAFSEELITYRATYDFKNDTLDQVPAGFTTSGNVTVAETRDLIAWYTNNPYSSTYHYVMLNDTASGSASSMEKTVTRLIQDGDFVEFWCRTDNATLESKFTLTDMNNAERLTVKMFQGYFWLTSGSYSYNSTVQVAEDVWYHIRLTLSKSNWSELFIDSQFVDNFKVNIGYDLKAFKFSTNIGSTNYALYVRGIGISWYDYARYENCPELADLDFKEETVGFGVSSTAAYVDDSKIVLASGYDANFSDFIFLNDTVILTNTGKIYDVAGEQGVLTSTIRNWSSAKVRYGDLYIMSETENHKGLTIYDISDPTEPLMIGDPLQDSYYETGDIYYGPVFEIVQHPTTFHKFAIVAFDEARVRWPEYYANRTPMITPVWYDVTNASSVSGNYYAFDVQMMDEYILFDPIDMYIRTNGTDYYIGAIVVDEYTDSYLTVRERLIEWRHSSSACGYPYSGIDYPKCTINYYHRLRVIGSWGEFYEKRHDYRARATVDESYVYVTTMKKTGNPLLQYDSYVIDTYWKQIAFKIGRTQLPYSIAPNSEANITLGLGPKGVVAYNSTKKMSIDIESMTGSNMSDVLVGGSVQRRGNGVYALEVYNGTIECPYITYFTTKKIGYVDDLSRIQTDGYANFQIGGRYNALELLEGHFMEQSLMVSNYGSLSFQTYIHNETKADLDIITSNGSSNATISLNISDCKLNFGDQSITLDADQWNPVSMLYLSDYSTGNGTLVISASNGQISIPLSDFQMLHGFSVVCTDGTINIDQYHQQVYDTDSDGDGLTDIDEMYNWGTDPLSSDDDGDGMPDGWEAQYGLDPTFYNDRFYDNDTDGLINVFEFFNGTKPIDWDTDRDGESDGSECIHGTSPLYPFDGDNDKDGVMNYIEELFHMNPESSDTDSDELLDNVEFELGTRPEYNDTDGDGMWDGYEVQCSLNPKSNDGASDYDGDKITNWQEWNGSIWSNWARTNASINVDTDLDGMSQDWETYYNVNSNTSDAEDQDKVNNLQEYTANTNPRVVTTNYSMTQDWATYWNIEFSQAGADADYDADKVKSSQEYAGIYQGSTSYSSNPNESVIYDPVQYNMRRDWASYWWISFSQAGADADTDSDKLLNWQEFMGRYDGFNTNNVLNPRTTTPIPTSSFTYQFPNGTEVTRYWVTEWNIYYNLVNPTSIDDSDGDKVLDWQELYGRWNAKQWNSISTCLDPRNKTEAYGMSKDWCSYYDITYSDAAGWLDTDNDGVKNRFEYGNNTNPRMADTDWDNLPDKFECIYRGTYGGNPVLDPTKRKTDGIHFDNVTDIDSDGINNYAEYRFDSSAMRMNPKYWDSDDDDHSDKTEYYLHWQYNGGSGLKHNNSQQISPIEYNSNWITYDITDTTSCWSLHSSTVHGTGTYVDVVQVKDTNHGWSYANGLGGNGNTNTYWNYSSSSYPGYNNATVRQCLSAVTLTYNAAAYSQSPSSQTLSEFKYQYQISDSYVWNYGYTVAGSGQLSIGEKNTFYYEEKELSTQYFKDHSVYVSVMGWRLSVWYSFPGYMGGPEVDYQRIRYYFN